MNDLQNKYDQSSCTVQNNLSGFKFGLILATRYMTGYNSFVPLGIGFVAESIREGLPKVEVILKEQLDDLISEKPDIIGISSTTENYYIAIEFAKRIKNELGIPVIIGGIHISLIPESLHDCFDIAVIGEGELTIIELLKSYLKYGRLNYEDLRSVKGLLFKTENGIVLTEKREVIEDLESLPKPKIESLPFYTKTDFSCIVSARGCPYKCSFCASEKFADHYRTQSIESIVDDIENLVVNQGTKHIVFYDDLLIANKKKIEQLINSLKKRDLLGKCSYSCQVRANLINEEMAVLLKELNVLDVGIGIETFSDKILQYYNKRGVTSEINQKALDILHKYNIKVNPSIILGASIETREDMLETFRALYINFRDGKIHSPGWGTLRPYPGTVVWEDAKKMGLVNHDMDWNKFSDWSNFELYMCKDVPVTEFFELIEEWKVKYSILTLDNPHVNGNFLIKDPVALVEKISQFKKRIITRTEHELGDDIIINFSKKSIDPIFLNGCHELLPDGNRWLSKESTVMVKYPVKKDVIMHGYIPDVFFDIYNQNITISVSLPDSTIIAQKLIERNASTNGGFSFNFSINPSEYASIIIKTDKTVIPKRDGINEDERELSFLLINFTIQETEEEKIEAILKESINLAEECINAENLVDAKNILNRVLEFDPKNIDGLNDLCVVALIEGNIEMAEKLLTAVFNIDSENEIAFANRKYLTN